MMMRSLLLAAAVLGLFAAPARAETVLKVGDQRGNARAVMEAAGVLDGAPYRIAWSEFPAAAPLLEALNAGAIETGVAGDAPFTFATAAGAPIRVVQATRSDQGGLAVLVRPDSPARSFADLKGKRVGTGRGSIGHQLVLASLEAAGLKPADIDLKFLLPADAKAALVSGSLDAWATWEPYTSQLEVAGQARILSDGRGITPGLSFQAARLDAIAGKRPELEDFLRRLAQARTWARAHPERFAEAWSHLIGLPEAVPLAWFRRADIRPVAIDEGVVADEQRTIDLYVRQGLIPKRLDAAAILDPSFNDAVRQGAAAATQ